MEIIPSNPISISLEDELKQTRKLIRAAQFDLKLTANKEKEPNDIIAEQQRSIAEAKKVFAEASAKAHRVYVDALVEAQTVSDETIAKARRTIAAQERTLRGLRAETRCKKKPFYAATEQYSKTDCRAFCSEFHKALSPELRQMVYEHLCPKDLQTRVYESEQLDSDDDAQSSDRRFIRRSKSPTYFEHTSRPHFFNPEFSGAVATELVAYIYRAKRYRFYPTDLRLMDRFLTTDIYNLGVMPGDVVQHIEIDVATQFQPDSDEPMAHSKVVEGLHKLSNMKNKSAQVKVIIGRDRELPLRAEHPLRGVVDFLERIGPSLYSLRALGFNTEVVGYYTGTKKGIYPRHVGSLSLKFPKTLDEFMEKTIPEYRAMDEECHARYIRMVKILTRILT